MAGKKKGKPEEYLLTANSSYSKNVLLDAQITKNETQKGP